MLVSVLTMLVLLLFVLIFPRAKNNNGRVSQQAKYPVIAPNCRRTAPPVLLANK